MSTYGYTATSLASPILEWWKTQDRDLPWRQTRDPWAILVSEVMSQQTQVERVVPKWRAFMDRFPTPAAAAASAAGEVIALWDGLGYNRRALLLHSCAIRVESDHGGQLPDTLDELLALPGVGPYTARAVLAFAFERDVAVLDTNVGRILARVGGCSLRPAAAQAFADGLVPGGRGWEWNQAILDFGATVCTKRTPACGQCPVRRECAWAGVGVDPARGSAGVGAGQSAFEGSDRQGRGKLISALRHGPARAENAAALMGFADDPVRAQRVMETLLDDGLMVRDLDWLRLP